MGSETYFISRWVPPNVGPCLPLGGRVGEDQRVEVMGVKVLYVNGGCSDSDDGGCGEWYYG